MVSVANAVVARFVKNLDIYNPSNPFEGKINNTPTVLSGMIGGVRAMDEFSRERLRKNIFNVLEIEYELKEFNL